MKITSLWPEVIKYLIFLAIGWFVFCVLVGLFKTFDLLEASKEPSQTSAMFKGLKISGIMFFTGVIVMGSILAIFSRNKKKEP